MTECNHVWKEDGIPIFDIDDPCDEHPGVRCIVDGCYEYVDLVWEDDPRNEGS